MKEQGQKEGLPLPEHYTGDVDVLKATARQSWRSREDERVRQRGLNEFLILHCMVSLFLTPSPFLRPSFLFLILLCPKAHTGGK